jgi:hypothetical protein
MMSFWEVRNAVRRAAIVALLVVAAQTYAGAQFTVPKVPPKPATLPAYQTIPASFDITGFIESATLDGSLCPPAPPLTPGCKAIGGWIKVNGHVIQVPQNTVLQFPANTLTWEEVFEFNPFAAAAPGTSGLALSDPPAARLPITAEAHIQGNIVHGTYIAGLIFISQQAVNSSQGFIEAINYPLGALQVNGTWLQINDPILPAGVDPRAGKGRYSAGQSPDPRFSADQDNPTIVVETGIPACIPATAPAGGLTSDPYCPEDNRPRDLGGNLVNIFTMPIPQADPLAPTLPGVPNPWLPVPFEVGDYITYNGTTFLDATGAITGTVGTPYISAHTIVNNLGVFTFPRYYPTYVTVNVLLQGTGGVANPAFPQEAGIRTRVEGMATDPSQTVDISAYDTDCNGISAFRGTLSPPPNMDFNLASLSPWVLGFPIDFGPPLVGKKGRFRFRPGGGNFLPASRNAAALITNFGPDLNGTQPQGINPNTGLRYGEFRLPDFTLIFPENLASGNPPVPANFRDLYFLVNGEGPWRGDQTQTLGQLNPFPDATVPAPSCIASPGGIPLGALAVANFTSTPNPPVAGTVVTLNAAGSTPANGPFLWGQFVFDPVQVTITNPTGQVATFVAPTVSIPTTLNFVLTVGGGSTIPSTVVLAITINPAGSGAAPGITAFSTPLATTAAPVRAGLPVTLTATGIDPALPGCVANCSLTFAWTAADAVTAAAITNGQITLVSGAADGSIQTFTTPNFNAPTAGQFTYAFNVTGTSSVAPNLTGAATVSVVVNPTGGDTITITNVIYRSVKKRLIINAFDTTPNVVLTVTLDTINPATGTPWTGVMGPAIPAAPFTYSLIFANMPPPGTVTVKSNLGAVATSGITSVRPN